MWGNYVGTLEISRAKSTAHRSGRIMFFDRATDLFAHVLFDLDPINYEDPKDYRGLFVVDEIFTNILDENEADRFRDIIALSIHFLFNNKDFKDRHRITHTEILIGVGELDENPVHSSLMQSTTKFLVDEHHEEGDNVITIEKLREFARNDSVMNKQIGMYTAGEREPTMVIDCTSAFATL